MFIFQRGTVSSITNSYLTSKFKETICMQCQNQISGKSKKIFKLSSAEIVTKHAKH